VLVQGRGTGSGRHSDFTPRGKVILTRLNLSIRVDIVANNAIS